jgi:glycosyltransferase involved in cell wall biosynthesis
LRSRAEARKYTTASKQRTKTTMRALYISHMGMTEPLGQSQVLPYLIGLARRGVEIEILSFEAWSTKPETIDALRARLEKEGLHYNPLMRSPSHKLSMKLWESAVGVGRALELALRRRPRVVHARSYLPGAVADMVATLSPQARLLFDCRGMLGEEYVEGGHWTKDRLEYKLLKRFEHRIFRRAEGMVVLTRALERWLRENDQLGRGTRVQVIPCCVDMDRFKPDPVARARVRKELGVEDRLVVVYSGSLGHWYGEKEMAKLVGALKRRAPETFFLLLSKLDTTKFRELVRAEGLGDGDFLARGVAPAQMPEMLTAGDLGLSLIEPCFSKRGSSPTKVAEYLAAGMPVVVNKDVGDQGELAADPGACAVIDSLALSEVERAPDLALPLARRPYDERSRETYRVARSHFSLAEIGVPRYAELYESLDRGRRTSPFAREAHA